ncbi:hypothetical protein LOD99_5643 [Oopsacas minuta]|uniref:Uncharacterized protein n=1 Tax=Oopsacas minuta TaxID=111878 RepID=A0AAV7JQE5_9METZ|nr:hypothetical protein LOD99_5643 [Oopsacas minuta]
MAEEWGVCLSPFCLVGRVLTRQIIPSPVDTNLADTTMVAGLTVVSIRDSNSHPTLEGVNIVSAPGTTPSCSTKRIEISTLDGVRKQSESDTREVDHLLANSLSQSTTEHTRLTSDNFVNSAIVVAGILFKLL